MRHLGDVTDHGAEIVQMETSGEVAVALVADGSGQVPVAGIVTRDRIMHDGMLCWVVGRFSSRWSQWPPLWVGLLESALQRESWVPRPA